MHPISTEKSGTQQMTCMSTIFSANPYLSSSASRHPVWRGRSQSKWPIHGATPTCLSTGCHLYSRHTWKITHKYWDAHICTVNRLGLVEMECIRQLSQLSDWWDCLTTDTECMYAQSRDLALRKWNALDNYHNYQTGETVSPLIQSACMHSQQTWPCRNGMH